MMACSRSPATPLAVEQSPGVSPSGTAVHGPPALTSPWISGDFKEKVGKREVLLDMLSFLLRRADTSFN